MSLELKRYLILAARLIGMAFVILSVANFIRHMAFVRSVTGDSKPLLIVGLLSAGLLYWAYRVIWRPLPIKSGE